MALYFLIVTKISNTVSTLKMYLDLEPILIANMFVFFYLGFTEGIYTYGIISVYHTIA